MGERCDTDGRHIGNVSGDTAAGGGDDPQLDDPQLDDPQLEHHELEVVRRHGVAAEIVYTDPDAGQPIQRVYEADERETPLTHRPLLPGRTPGGEITYTPTDNGVRQMSFGAERAPARKKRRRLFRRR
ncbi:MAG: hypothetical protein AAF567_04345 [Actinomycetota bacterium]